nr:hypothetical protein KitaXyl93_75960 [Kitasatospora sp. Xyl93]
MRCIEQEVAAQLRAARAVKQVTLAEAGRHAGYSPSAVSRILAGKMAVPPEALRAMAQFLEIPLHRVGLSVSAAPASLHAPPAGSRVASAVGSSEGDVRRREFIAVGAAGITALALGTGRAAALSLPQQEVDPVEQALFGTGRATPPAGRRCCPAVVPVPPSARPVRASRGPLQAGAA